MGVPEIPLGRDELARGRPNDSWNQMFNLVHREPLFGSINFDIQMFNPSLPLLGFKKHSLIWPRWNIQENYQEAFRQPVAWIKKCECLPRFTRVYEICVALRLYKSVREGNLMVARVGAFSKSSKIQYISIYYV